MHSHLDTLSHPIKCANPKCGEVFEETYRRLFERDKVICPKCRTPKDIRESKRTGEIGSWIDTVTDMDKKIDKKK
jgi:hypothetical protein